MTEKFDETKIRDDLALIKQVCTDVDFDLISLIYHECEYDIQQTITRIHSGDFQESGGWQTAKTNHRKKTTQQHSTEIPSTRPIRPNPPVRRPNPLKTVETTEPSAPRPATPPLPVVSSANFDEKKRISSKPVKIYRALKLTSFPIDICFGDIQWKDDEPFAVTPTNSISEQQITSTNDLISQPENSTTNSVEPTESTISNFLQTTNETNSPTFVPLNSPANLYASSSTDFPPANSTNSFKSTSKTSTNYSPQTPVYHVGNFSYPANSPSLVPFVMPFDSWSNNGFNQPVDNYSYATANYHVQPNYSNQQHFYSQQKFDTMNFDRDVFGSYASSSPLNSIDPSPKENPMKSRLSANAAAFPAPFSLTNYPYHYPSIDTRDHRATGSYPNNNVNHRNNYYGHRNYPSNANNWHSQQ